MNIKSAVSFVVVAGFFYFLGWGSSSAETASLMLPGNPPLHLESMCNDVLGKIKAASDPQLKGEHFIKFEKEWSEAITKYVEQVVVLSKSQASAPQIEVALKKIGVVIVVDLEGDGSAYISKDPSWLLKKFLPVLPPDLASYLKQATLEEQTPGVHDGGVIMPWIEIAKRITYWENYMTTFPKTLKFDDAKKRLSWNAGLFVSGLDNTPPYDFPTYKVSPEVLSAWRNFLKSNPNSKIVPIVKIGLDYLGSHGGQLKESIVTQMYRKTMEL